MTSEENNEMDTENPDDNVDKDITKISTEDTAVAQSAFNGANSAATNNGFRVKNVSEINDSVDGANITDGTNEKATTNKRKFPTPAEEENKENGGTSNQIKNNRLNIHNDDSENDNDNNESENNHNEKKCKLEKDSKISKEPVTNTKNNNNNNNNRVTVDKPLPEVQIETAENESASESSTDNTATSSKIENNSKQEPAVKIKVEPACRTENENSAETSTSTARSDNVSVPKPFPEDVKVLKTEPQNNDAEASCSHTNNSNGQPPAQSSVKVERADASSTTRESCRFGIRCYRRNILHRQQEAHPGDVDYRRPTYPSPPEGTPPCPFGNLCYRRNPIHFEEYSHPPNTDFKENYRNYRRGQASQQISSSVFNNDSDSDSADENLFSDSGSEYLESDNETSMDSDEFLADYDDCDRAEE